VLAAWGFAHNSPCGLKQVGSTAAARRQPQAAALLAASNGGGRASGSLRIVLEAAHIACGDVQPRTGPRCVPIESPQASSLRMALFVGRCRERADFPRTAMGIRRDDSALGNCVDGGGVVEARGARGRDEPTHATTTAGTTGSNRGGCCERSEPRPQPERQPVTRPADRWTAWAERGTRGRRPRGPARRRQALHLPPAPGHRRLREAPCRA